MGMHVSCVGDGCGPAIGSDVVGRGERFVGHPSDEGMTVMALELVLWMIFSCLWVASMCVTLPNSEEWQGSFVRFGWSRECSYVPSMREEVPACDSRTS